MSTHARRYVDGLVTMAGRLNAIAAWSSVLFLAAMIVLVLIQIVGRYLGQGAPSWTEEAARYAMVWSGLLGGVAAFYQGADPVLMSVGAAHARWRQRAQVWAQAVCIALFTGVLLFHSWGFVARASARNTEALGWNLGLVVIVLPIYLAFILFLAITKLIVFELEPPGSETGEEERVHE